VPQYRSLSLQISGIKYIVIKSIPDHDDTDTTASEHATEVMEYEEQIWTTQAVADYISTIVD
jgi:hypothetical protein